MEQRSSQSLALRDRSAARGAGVVFTHIDPEPQYAVDPNALGEFALQWSTDRYNGMFSVMDFPAEWVTFVQTSIHGPWKETTYQGNAPFSVVLWNSMPTDDRVSDWIFSQVRLEAMQIGGMLGTVVDSIREAEVKAAEQSPPWLPSKGTLALPDRNTTTL